MSEEGKKSKTNKQSNSEIDERADENQRTEAETETEESEKDIKKQKSRTKNAAENAKAEPEKQFKSEYDERSSSGSSKMSAVDTNEERQEKEKKHHGSHIYLLQESSSRTKRTCHQPPATNVNVKARKKLIIASFLCVIFIIVTIVGGILSNSLAVAADAAHTMTDFAGFMISLFAIWLAGREPTERLSFGWYRAEVIGALVSVMTIWCVTAVLVWLAIERCIEPNFKINTIVMMITAAFGLITNIILGVQLSWGSSKSETSCDVTEIGTMGHQHHHHHHESWLEKLWKKLRCSKKKAKTRETIAVECLIDPSNRDNINIRTAILHAMTDALQSVGVLVAAIVIYYRPDWVIADPICTFIFGILVMFSTVKVMKDIGLVLMEGTPKFVDYQEVQRILESIEGVKSVHNLRIWALNVNRIALSAHLVAYQKMDAALILRKAEEAIHKRYHLYETTIQIEKEGEHE